MTYFRSLARSFVLVALLFLVVSATASQFTAAASAASKDPNPLWRGDYAVMKVAVPVAKKKGLILQVADLHTKGKWYELTSRNQVVERRLVRTVDRDSDVRAVSKFPFSPRELVPTNDALDFFVQELKLPNKEVIVRLNNLLDEKKAKDRKKASNSCSIYEQRVGASGYISDKALRILLIDGLDGEHSIHDKTVAIRPKPGRSIVVIDLRRAAPGGRITTKQLQRLWEVDLRLNAKEFDEAFKQALKKRNPAKTKKCK